MEEIDVKDIDISEANARKDISDEGLDELASSIQKHGLLQPIVVFKERGRYSLIIGQRRFRACKDKLGWTLIPARVIDSQNPTDAAILSFSENIHRLDLDYSDKMNVAARLLASLHSVPRVAEELGVSEPTVRNYLGYQGVPDEIKALVGKGGGLSTKTALEISRRVHDRELAIAVAKKVSEAPRKEKPKQRQLIAAASENAGKPLSEIEHIAERLRDVPITIHLTARVARALESASKELETDRRTLAAHAVEDWLTRRGHLS